MTATVPNKPYGNTWKAEIADDGEFIRHETSFRKWIRADGSSRFAPEPGRYHLYVSYACPWAHRTLIGRKLKGLEEAISYDVVDPILPPTGWSFGDDIDAATGDRVNRFSALREVYLSSDSSFAGAVTVPVLWDRQTSSIVNNESSEILRMFNGEFQDCAGHPENDLYPGPSRARIDELNDWIYPDINNGVYRCGFARSQAAYSRAFETLFEALDRVEEILVSSRYLIGPTLTEADVRLFTTLVRFDAVYVTHFKCNLRRIVDYPNLWGYLRDIYQSAGIAETVNMEHIKRHYFESHRQINPLGIVPDGPALDFEMAHDRAAVGR